MEEGASLLLHHTGCIGCLAQCECGMFGIAATYAIYSNQEAAIAALYGEVQCLVIGNDYGSHVQAMGCYSRE